MTRSASTILGLMQTSNLKLAYLNSDRDFVVAASGYTNDNLNAILYELSKCKCCWRHQHNRPYGEHLGVEVDPKSVNEPKCKCVCRHLARNVVRILHQRIQQHTPTWEVKQCIKELCCVIFSAFLISPYRTNFLPQSQFLLFWSIFFVQNPAGIGHCIVSFLYSIQ